MEVLQRMDYLIKKVFSEQNRPTFPHYRASQSKGSTRGLPWSNQVSLACTQDKTTHLHAHQMHSNFCTFKFRSYLISYTRLFTKLNLFNFILWYIYYNENFQIYSISTSFWQRKTSGLNSEYMFY